MPTPLTLYIESEDRAAKFRIAAKYAGIILQVKIVDPHAEETKKNIVNHTPFDRIPVLQTEDGYLARSNAILRYIAGLREDSGLYGYSLYEETLIDQLLEWSFTNLQPLSIILSNHVESLGYTNEQLNTAREAARSKLPTLLAEIDRHLITRTYLASDRLSLADICITSVLSTCIDNISSIIDQFTNIKRWYTTCRMQPNFVAVLGDVSSKDTAAPANTKAANNNKKSSIAGSNSSSSSSSSSSSAPAPYSSSSTGTGASNSYIIPEGDSTTGWPSLVGTGNDTTINNQFLRHRQRIVDVFRKGEQGIDSTVVICGWVRTIREQGKDTFIAISDGTCYNPIQVVVDKDSVEGAKDLATCGGTGSSLRIVGKIVKSPAKGQTIEVLAQKLEVLGVVQDPATYPLAKKKHNLETLREFQHLRSRTNTFGAVTRVRNACAYATHKFFNERGFLYIHTPIITTSDCEGAGEMFQVTTIMPDKPKQDLPRLKDGNIDYKKDFFGKPAMMTVSGQLQVEAFACSMGDVYTFGPTFRAENSHTSRHLAEFWMIEPEIAFATLEDDMALAEDYLKFCTQWVLDHCDEDLVFFESQFEKGLRDRLRNVVQEPFKKLTYTDAITLLTSPEHAAKGNFKEKVYWGCDLASEHERYITEKVFQKPVILINYPKDIKAFYMKLNPDQKTVAAMDVLVPKIGEIIGGSQREDNYELLIKRMDEMKVAVDPLKWYLELRKYGTMPHAGFGLGFERLVMYVTGIENIRDVIPFPRYPGNAEF